MTAGQDEPGDSPESSLDRGFDPNDPDNWIGLDYVQERVLAELDAQERRWQEVDSRLRMVLGVIGIVFAVARAFVRGGLPGIVLGSGSTPSTFIPLPFLVGATVDAAVLFYLAAGAMAAWAYQWRSLNRPLGPWTLRTYTTTDPREAKRDLIDTMVLMYYQNEQIISAKLRWFGRAFLLTIVATAALGAALLMQVAIQTQAWGV